MMVALRLRGQPMQTWLAQNARLLTKLLSLPVSRVATCKVSLCTCPLH